MNKVADCQLVYLPKIENSAGNLSVVQGKDTLPFDIKRVFYIYDIPSGKSRGAHAHIECHQLLIAASGSFSVEMNDGNNTKTVYLNQPSYGLHIPPGIWAHEFDFSAGAICLVLTSHIYNEADYIRDYNSYLTYIHDR